MNAGMQRLILFVLSGGLLAASAMAQRAPVYDSPEQVRAELTAALAARQQAEARASRYEAAATRAETAAARAADEAAALAARIQQAEAGIIAAQARIGMVDRERSALREEIGREQQPVVRLTAALQQFSRRPVALAVLRPGSVKNIVYLRAMLHDAVPQVQARTAGLRARIDRGRELRADALAATQNLRSEERALDQRRSQLAEVETRERLVARAAGGTASREAARALALAEEMRDLDQLMTEVDRAAALRTRLAALAGPRLRPARPGESSEAAPDAAQATQSAAAPSPYILPVAGRTLAGFGSPQGTQTSQGITLAPVGGAQVVAPAAGRVAFAGPYRGYGQIVIIEHAGGWTSLVTGLARADVAVGEQIGDGAPLGVAGPERPTVTLELRRGGTPVNPLLIAR